MRSLRKSFKSKVIAARLLARCFGLALLTGQLCFAADNVTVSNGQNSDNPDYVTATDDVSGVHYQRMKLIDPTADSTAAIGVEANPLWCSISGTVPLPTGAATSALQSTGNSSLSSIDGKLPALVTGRIPVDGSGVIQPVSGTITANLGTIAGVATESTLSSLNTKVPSPVSGRVPVDGSGVTQPVSASSLPLPAGASTESTLSDLNGKFVTMPSVGPRDALEVLTSPGGLLVAQSGVAAGSTSTVLNTDSNISATVYRGDAAYITLTEQFPWTSNGAWSVVEAVTSSTLTLSHPLPFTPSASAKIWIYRRQPIPMQFDGSGNNYKVSVAGEFGLTSSNFYDGLLADPVFYGIGLLANRGGLYRDLASATSAPSGSEEGLVVRNIPSGTQTVSGTIAATQSGTWNVNNISGTVSLPTGAATSANQSTQITALQLLDDVVATTGSAIPTKGYALSGTDGTNARIIKTDTAGEIQADILSSALPTGAATEITLASVDGKLPSLVSGRVPVDGSGVTQPVSGTLTCNAGTNLNTSALALESGGNLAAIAASGSVLDDWDESDRAKVNPIVGQAGIDGGSGASSAKTTRVIIATDQGGFAVNRTYYASLTNTGTTSLTTARKLYGLKCGNGSTTTQAFPRAYDKATAGSSSDTPIAKIPLGPLAGWSDKIDYFSYDPVANGLSLRCTTGVADNNTTSPTANDCFCTVWWNT